MCPLMEAREKTKCLQVRFLNHIFRIFLVFHQPTSQVVCIIHKWQDKRFKTRPSILVIHGRGLLYDKSVPKFADFYSRPRISRCGLFILNGAGEPAMPSESTLCEAVSGQVTASNGHIH